MASTIKEREEISEACKVLTDFIDDYNETNEKEFPCAFIIIAVNENDFQHVVDDRIPEEILLQICNKIKESIIK